MRLEHSTTITVIDYGMVNLYNVTCALRYCGFNVLLTRSPQEIEAATHVILPGVGAFKDGMAELQQRKLVEPIKAYAASGRPLLGICLGAQMLMSYGEEFGIHPGLDLIKGRVAPIPAKNPDGVPHKVPHIGWNSLAPGPAGESAWKNTPLADTKVNTRFYFVHSFHCEPADPAHILAVADYNGLQITAAIKQGNLYGCQFHPEKSAQVGLQILKNFGATVVDLKAGSEPICLTGIG